MTPQDAVAMGANRIGMAGVLLDTDRHQYVGQWVERDDDAGLRSMCDEGVRRIQSWPYKGHTLRFDCWNEDEATFIDGYMRHVHPGVDFWCTWMVFRR